MPSFCPRCGDFLDVEACVKCGEKAVTAKENPWKAGSVPGGDPSSVPAVPTAFTAAARIKLMGVQPLPEPTRKEQAVARFHFVPQDASTQLALSKGDEVDIVRKDDDGWWFVIKDGEKGLVPGSYLYIENPVLPITDASILAARETSNQRFMELQKGYKVNGQGALTGVEYQSPLGLKTCVIADSCAPKPPSNPACGADAKSGGTEFKPGEVRKLRKCYACKETILGRTKVCKSQIFHEICLLCKGCRESIEENEDFALIKKKAYHADCAEDVNHCILCDKDILGRVYRAGGGTFHKLCMICSVCNKQSTEIGAKLESGLFVCGECIAIRERNEREAALELERAASKAKAEKEAALAAARALEEEKERKVRDAQKAAEEAAKHEAQAAAAARAQAENEAAEADATQKFAAAAVANGNRRFGSESFRSSSSNLDEFDLGANPIDLAGQNGRISEASDLDSVLSDGDYAGYMGTSQRESLRLSEVLDLESYSDRLSDLSGISEGTNEVNRPRQSTIVDEHYQTYSEDDDDRELCGGCNLVLEGEAVGALNKYYHYECFKCSHCSRVIAEDDGYAEKDNQAFHQGCYQARFGKKCNRCDKVLKGKVVKALDLLYHPDCFVCFQCNASLSESFFEHEGQAICAKCKHGAIALDESIFPRLIDVIRENLNPVSKGIAGYRFDAQDDTQLTIYPGDEVTILQKDEDGWWLVELRGKRGYVPGSYLIERPIETTNLQLKKEKNSSKIKLKSKAGLCSACATQNPAEARFCRNCGNNLVAN